MAFGLEASSPAARMRQDCSNGWRAARRAAAAAAALTALWGIPAAAPSAACWATSTVSASTAFSAGHFSGSLAILAGRDVRARSARFATADGGDAGSSETNLSWESAACSFAAFAGAALVAVAVSLAPVWAETQKDQVAGFAEFAEKGGAMDVNPSCFITSCGKQTKECFAEDSRCLKGALCLSRCRGGQDCATQCFAEYGCKRLDAWLNCTVEKEKCVSVPPQLIDVNKWFVENVPKKLPNFDVAQMQGTWYKVRGYNSKYDCYLCQPNRFDYTKGADTLKADIQLRVPKLKSGGFWQNNVAENLKISPEGDRSTFVANGEIFGLSFDEEWYVLAGDDDYKLVAYKGKNLQDIYEGAFIYTRTPSLPSSIEGKARAAAEAKGYVWSKFCIVDNSCPAQTEVKQEAAKLTWDDIPDLIEWFAPGTVPKKLFSGQYNE